MPYSLDTAIRQILRPEHSMHQYERLHLTREGFRLEKGLWVRRYYLEPRSYDLVFEVEGDDPEKLLKLAEASVKPSEGE